MFYNYFCRVINKKKVSGIILSGGKSSRMGSEKGLKIFRGKPLVEYAIEALSPYCGNLILSTNNPSYYKKYELIKIGDEIENIGPMGGIYSCLKKSSTNINIFLSCDMPFVDSNLIKYLMENIDVDIDALVPVHGGNKVEPLCAYYHSGLLSTLKSFVEIKNYKLMDFLDSINTKKLTMEDWRGYNELYFSNFNTPEDIKINS